MPVKSQAQFRAMQAAAHGNSTLGIPSKVGREFADTTSKKRLHKLPARMHKSADPAFDQRAADTVYKAMTAMDPDTALVFGRILVADAVYHDLLAHRGELAKMAADQAAERAETLKRYYTRTAVSKARRGADNTHEIACLVEIGKAFAFTAADRERYARGRTREHGRFVQEHRAIDTDPAATPITDSKHLDRIGVPKAQMADGTELKGADLAHYQQAYGQIMDMVGNFRNPELGAVLHLKVERNGTTRDEQVPVTGKQPRIAEKLKPNDRITSAAVSVVPSPTAAGATFDALAAAGAPRLGAAAADLHGGVLSPSRLREFNQARQTVEPNENFSAGARAFGRLERGSSLLQDSLGPAAPPHLQYALAVANHIGQLGPEAQKVLGPTADRMAYRYRGTERTTDPTLARAFGQLRRPGRTAKDVRDAAVGGIESPRDGWDPGPVLRYFHRQLPSPDLNELQRKSGVIPPSEGIIIGADGQITHQSVGFADDWYLPFNLRHLKALKGGEYIRTRTFGGPSTEDIYTGLVSGARSLTVVSHSGVFTVDFDRNLRGGRRFNDKAARMVARYGQLLDAVRSEQVSRGGISPSRMAELNDQARRFEPDTKSEAFRSRLRELRTAEQENPQLSVAETNAAAMDWLKNEAAFQRTADGREMTPAELVGEAINRQAQTEYNTGRNQAAAMGVRPVISEEEYRTAARQQVFGSTPTDEITAAHVAAIAGMLGKTDRFNRAMRQANDESAKRARALRLDGAGYEAALNALQEQFPYYLTTHYQPWRGSMGIEALTARSREGTADTGYVAPRHNRPQAAQAGYFNDRVGQGKVEASSTRYQNFRVHGGKLREPDENKDRAKDRNGTSGTAGTTRSSNVPDADARRAANLSMLDELLSHETFGPNAKIGNVDNSYRSIRDEIKAPGFPGGPLKVLYGKDRGELESMPDKDLESLMDAVLNMSTGPEKVLAIPESKIREYKNKGKASAAATPPPNSLGELVRGFGRQDFDFPGIAFDPARASVADIENAYRDSPDIKRLVDRGELPQLDDQAFPAKIESLRDRLREADSANVRARNGGRQPDRDQLAQDTRDATAMVKARQLRDNWLKAQTREAAASTSEAASTAGTTTNQFINLSGMTPEEQRQALGL
jgi:hypothetical protein